MATQYNAPALLAAAFNARAWSGAALFNRGGGADVTLPSYTAIGDGLFRDPLDILNGRGSSGTEALPLALAGAWTGAGTATCGLDANGFFYIEADTDDFTISASANNAIFGFDVGGHGLVGGAAPYRRTAPGAWTLGPWVNKSITIDPAGAGAAFTLGGSRYWQDLPTALRSWGGGDADDRNPSNNLQALDEVIYGSSVRWLLDDTGHVVTAWRTGVTVAPTWVSTTFRNRLGFSGLETTASVGVVDYLRADYPLPGTVLIPDGLEQHEIGAVTQQQVRDLSSGGVAAVVTDHHQVRLITGYLRGPSQGASQDVHRHYVGSRQRPGFASYAMDGRRHVTLYPRWGDPRRWLDPMAVTASQPANDLLYTTGLAGYRGRVEGSLAKATQPEQRLVFEGAVRSFARVSWVIKEET